MISWLALTAESHSKVVMFEIRRRTKVPLSFSLMREAAAVNMSIMRDNANSAGTYISNALSEVTWPTVCASNLSGPWSPVMAAANS
jgi:hypothetical protein